MRQDVRPVGFEEFKHVIYPQTEKSATKRHKRLKTNLRVGEISLLDLIPFCDFCAFLWLLVYRRSYLRNLCNLWIKIRPLKSPDTPARAYLQTSQTPAAYSVKLFFPYPSARFAIRAAAPRARRA